MWLRRRGGDWGSGPVRGAGGLGGGAGGSVGARGGGQAGTGWGLAELAGLAAWESTSIRRAVAGGSGGSP